MKINFTDIQEKIGYNFKEKYLLLQAFTRSSFAAENQQWEDNEKLEFVGDKVLDLVVVKKLTSLHGFKAEKARQSLDSLEKGEMISINNIVETFGFEFAYSESEMTEIKKQIVQTSFLAGAIERMGLEKYLLMSKGDIKNNVQNEPHVKEDLLEAIIGAIAIDSGWDFVAIESAIEKMLNLDYNIRNGVEDGADYVSLVQNWYSKEFGTEPEYVFYENRFEDVFECYLDLKGYNKSFDGTGYSKKAAIRTCAKRAYSFIKEKQENCNNLLEVVGEFDRDSAIGKLQMLADKKLITGLEFIFREKAPTAESGGNPIWYCECRVDGVDEFIEWGCEKKAGAKKCAAYNMLDVLTTGRDREAFDTTGIVIETEIIKEDNHNDK